MGLESVVGIAACYGLEGLGIESRWGEAIFSAPGLLCNGQRVVPMGKVAGVRH